MAPEQGRVLEYATPRPERPRPIGRRALLTGAAVALVGAMAALLQDALPGRLRMGAGVTFGIACGVLCIVALTAGWETLFFRRNVADPGRAALACVGNVAATACLLALWRGLHG